MCLPQNSLSVKSGYIQYPSMKVRIDLARALKKVDVVIKDEDLFWDDQSVFAINYPDTVPQKIEVSSRRYNELLNENYKSSFAFGCERFGNLSKVAAKKDLDFFEKSYGEKYPKAVECLTKDWKVLTNYFDFPASHWIHLRTTNPIESSFATVKLRTKVTKGAGSKAAAEVMTFKLLKECEKSGVR